MTDEPIKMVKITGELAKAAGIPEDAEPMPLDYILEFHEAMFDSLSAMWRNRKSPYYEDSP